MSAGPSATDSALANAAPLPSFDLGEEQRVVLEQSDRWAQDELYPLAPRMDAEEWWPEDVMRRFGRMGYLGITVPESYGGAGLDLFTSGLLLQSFSRWNHAVALSWVAHENLCLNNIWRNGSEAQRRKYLPRLCDGSAIGALGLTEPGAGSDALGSMRTTARREGDHYILNGTKLYITNAGIAHVNTIFAVTDPEKGTKGTSCFVVEDGTPGFHLGKVEHKMGIRGSQTGELVFEDCVIPAENLLGKEGDGFKIALATLDRTRPGIAAQALGIAQGALDFAVDYARQRSQFGKPIFENQAIQFMLADMDIKVEAARRLVYHVGGLIDASAPRFSRESAIAKTYASDIAMEVTNDAIQVLGGYGYMKEFPVERMMRDAKICQIYEGTNQIQRMVIARALTQSGG